MKRLKYFAFALLVAAALFARTQAAGTEYCEQANDCSIDGCPQEDCYCDSSVNKCLPIESAVR